MKENLLSNRDLAWEHSSNKGVDGLYTEQYWVRLSVYIFFITTDVLP